MSSDAGRSVSCERLSLGCSLCSVPCDSPTVVARRIRYPKKPAVPQERPRERSETGRAMTLYPVPKPQSKPKVRVSWKHGKPLKRTRMKSRGPRTKRTKGNLFPKGRDESLLAWVSQQPCVILGRRYESAAGYLVGPPHECQSPVQVCHVKSRGAGGSDRNNTVSMCAHLHALQHTIGIRSFQTRWGVNLKEIAQRLTAAYEAEKFPCP